MDQKTVSEALQRFEALSAERALAVEQHQALIERLAELKQAVGEAYRALTAAQAAYRDCPGRAQAAADAKAAARRARRAELVTARAVETQAARREEQIRIAVEISDRYKLEQEARRVQRQAMLARGHKLDFPLTGIEIDCICHRLESAETVAEWWTCSPEEVEDIRERNNISDRYEDWTVRMLAMQDLGVKGMPRRVQEEWIAAGWADPAKSTT